MNLKYGPQILEDTRRYIDRCKDGNHLPSITGLARRLGVNKISIKRWREKYDDFGDLIKKINLLQELMLLENGLNGTWNSNLVKLMLYNHGYGKDQDDQKDQNQPRQVNLIFKGIDGTAKDDDTVT